MKKNLISFKKKLVPLITGTVLLFSAGFLLPGCEKNDPANPATAQPSAGINLPDKDVIIGRPIPAPDMPVIPKDALLYIYHGGCIGACPSYSITISHSGLVTYNGISPALGDDVNPGDYEISPEQAKAFVAMLTDKGFFSLANYYYYNPYQPYHVTAVQDGLTKAKVVVDCGIEVPAWLGLVREQIEAGLGIDKAPPRDMGTDK